MMTDVQKGAIAADRLALTRPPGGQNAQHCVPTMFNNEYDIIMLTGKCWMHIDAAHCQSALARRHELACTTSA